MNNQVGFTTDPDDARSTRWASDLAKGFDVPIIHVNADDVEACISRGAARVRLPPGVRPRRADRPDRLPPLRPQRGRRARLHAARDVREDQAPPSARASSTPTQLIKRRRRHPGGGRRMAQEVWDELTRLHQQPQGADQRAGGRHGRAADRRVPARPHAVARRRDGRPGRRACASSTRSCSARPRASPSTRSSSSSSSAGARRSATRAASTGRTPRRSRSPRCSPRARRSA